MIDVLLDLLAHRLDLLVGDGEDGLDGGLRRRLGGFQTIGLHILQPQQVIQTLADRVIRGALWLLCAILTKWCSWVVAQTFRRNTFSTATAYAIVTSVASLNGSLDFANQDFLAFNISKSHGLLLDGIHSR